MKKAVPGPGGAVSRREREREREREKGTPRESGACPEVNLCFFSLWYIAIDIVMDIVVWCRVVCVVKHVVKCEG